MSYKLRLKKNKNISKKDYSDKNEFNYDSKTNFVPVNNKRLICLIFSEDKGAYFVYRSLEKNNYFTFNKGMYIIDNEAIHLCKNGARIAFYLEGISTPLKMSNIEKELKEVEYTDLYGNKRISIIQKIKGLKFDSKILNTFANERFAEIFTKYKIDNFQLIIMILSIIMLVMLGINYGLVYYFR